ncbi:hypothetical protein C2I06_14455 [Niallia circulans]|nr:hypothetical protein C2I06_14455 [Niallia circulans]PAD25481.1 hypothetical protein CHH62_11895 [Niallia circulans]UQZ75968.1 hypothetical protein C2I17_16215 [Niallia circulans]
MQPRKSNSFLYKKAEIRIIEQGQVENALGLFFYEIIGASASTLLRIISSCGKLKEPFLFFYE